MEVGKTPDKQTKDPDLITIGVMRAIMKIECMKHSRNHAMSVTHHYNEKDTYRWKKAYKDAIPPDLNFLSPSKRSKLSLRHTLARFLWQRRGLLCIQKIKATDSNRYFHPQLPPVGYSLFYTPVC